MKKNRDWTPVRAGPLYCSPACGGRCTWLEYRQAVRDAYRLVRKLRGRGWKPVVWENLGWHWKAVSGPVQVYGDRAASDERGRSRYRYRCLISDSVEDPVGGSSLWTNRCPERVYYEPNEAVEAMFRAALEATNEVLRAVHAASQAVEGRAFPALAFPSLVGGASIADRELAALLRSETPRGERLDGSRKVVRSKSPARRKTRGT